MKIITYNLATGEAGHRILTAVEIRCADAQLEAHEAMARQESWDGRYTVTDGTDEPAALTVAERLDALERTVQIPLYAPGTWYYRGDRVDFEGVMYTCVAPVGVVCVWSPLEYPTYWQEG